MKGSQPVSLGSGLVNVCLLFVVPHLVLEVPHTGPALAELPVPVRAVAVGQSLAVVAEVVVPVAEQVQEQELAAGEPEPEEPERVVVTPTAGVQVQLREPAVRGQLEKRVEERSVVPVPEQQRVQELA